MTYYPLSFIPEKIIAAHLLLYILLINNYTSISKDYLFFIN